MADTEITRSTQLQYLPFEQEVARLDREIADLQQDAANNGVDNAPKIRALLKLQAGTLRKLYDNLTPWQVVQVARHPQRPLLQDYLNYMAKDVRILHGDRCFGDDRAIVTALAHIGRDRVLLVGQEKGRDTDQKIACNFGCPNPEGYRKALAKMKLAEKFGLPIVTLIDTPGAFPGVGAEERGQAQAIAVNLMEMSRLKVPIICIVIGEGGSGGALGIGVGDRLAILENAYYSVISPEGCAGILWHDGSQASAAAEALGLTGKQLLKLGLVDTVIPEALGGAHRNIHDTIYNVEQYVVKTLRELKRTNIENLLAARHKKLRAIGSEQQKVLRQAPAPEKRKPKIPDRLSAAAQLEEARRLAEESTIEIENLP